MVSTRSGRNVKKPERYEPVEVPIDDYSDVDDDDFDDDGEDIEESDFESESESDEDDADDNGNLKGFVVSDDEDDEDFE